MLHRCGLLLRGIHGSKLYSLTAVPTQLSADLRSRWRVFPGGRSAQPGAGRPNINSEEGLEQKQQFLTAAGKNMGMRVPIQKLPETKLRRALLDGPASNR